MPMGPGKYDDECTRLREATDADTVILVVINGSKGGGFSVQTIDPNFDMKLPSVLEAVARQIRDSAPPLSGQ